MGNGNRNVGRTGDALVDREFQRQKEFQLAFRQAGQIKRRIRPLSTRHCLIVAGLCLILAVSLILVLIDQKSLMMFANWGR